MSDFVFSSFIVAWLSVSVRLAGPLLLASLGEVFGQRAGVVNIGIEGLMLLGAVASYIATVVSGNALIGVAAALGTGLVFGLVLAWFYVTVRADQIVTGLIFNLFAFGLSSYVYVLFAAGEIGPQKVDMFTPIRIPGLSDLPGIGAILFTHAAPLYVTLLLAVIGWLMLTKTRFGLSLRAVGENPQAAAAAGIYVSGMRYIGVLLSSSGAALAGAYLVLVQVGLFRETIVAGQGFIALTIVIFGRWHPLWAVVAAAVFAAADALQLSLQLYQLNLAPQLLFALPYLLTVIAMSGLLGRVRQPEALLRPYARE